MREYFILYLNMVRQLAIPVLEVRVRCVFELKRTRPGSVQKLTVLISAQAGICQTPDDKRV